MEKMKTYIEQQIIDGISHDMGMLGWIRCWSGLTQQTVHRLHPLLPSSRREVGRIDAPTLPLASAPAPHQGHLEKAPSYHTGPTS